MPKCVICGEIKKSLQPHLKHKHNMTVAQYKDTYNSPVYDYNPADRLKEWEEREPERSRKIRSEIAKRNVQIMNQYNRDHPEVLLETRRANGLKVGLRGDNNLQKWRDSVGPEIVSARCAEAGHLSSISKGHEFMARVALKNNRYCHYEYSSEKFNISRKFASRWEVNFIKLCESVDFITSLVHEPFGIDYIYEDKLRKYYPDFLVNNKYVVEIKPEGRRYEEIVLVKERAAEEFCMKNSLKYMILTEAVLFTIRNGEITTSAQQELKGLLEI